MTDHEPTATANLDHYGFGLPPLSWERPREILADGPGRSVLFVLGTIGADGLPHAAGIGPVWLDGDLYFTSGAGTRKSRDLEATPACTLSARLSGIDLILEGEARRTSDPATLEQVAGVYRAAGRPTDVTGEALSSPFNAPSAGPPPWSLYRFTFHAAVGVATAEPYGATRWVFAR